MSGNVEVGDAIELTFNTTTGAAVTMSWLDPSSIAVLDMVAVPEAPAGSGAFPRTLLPTAPGMWEARFYASGAATAVESYWVRAVSATGPPPLATLGEIAAQFGTLSTAQEALAKTLLRAASKLARQRAPLVDTHIANGKLDPEVAGLAVSNMVLRVLRNPRGLRAETTGPFSVTYDTTVAAGQLVLSDSDLGMLTPRRASAAGKVGTIMVRPGLPLPGRYRRG